jgi:uncharacterized low-complexity protein
VGFALVAFFTVCGCSDSNNTSTAKSEKCGTGKCGGNTSVQKCGAGKCGDGK